MDTPRVELRRHINGQRPTGAHLLGRVDPTVRDVVKEAVDKGGLLRAGSGKHPMSVICPDGERLTLSTSTSDHRARKNVIAYFRRHGLDVGPRPQKPKVREPGQQRAAAWLALQPEDREFTSEDFAAEMGLSASARSGHVRAYIRAWLDKGRIHEVRRTHRPNQRGTGTPVYSRRPPLRVVDQVEPVPHEDFRQAILADEINEAVSAHVADCEECTELTKNLQTVVAVAPSLMAPPPPADLVPRIMARIAEERQRAAPEPAQDGLRSQMWRNISEALLLLAQAAEIRARLEA